MPFAALDELKTQMYCYSLASISPCFSQEKEKNLTITEAARHLLATALLDPHNSHFVLMCEATVPFFNFTFTRQCITNTPYSFVEATPSVWEHWQAALFPREDRRVGEPWFALQRRHAALVVSSISFYRAVRQAQLPDDLEARSYFSTLLSTQDPGGFYNRTLVYAR